MLKVSRILRAKVMDVEAARSELRQDVREVQNQKERSDSEEEGLATLKLALIRFDQIIKRVKVFNEVPEGRVFYAEIPDGPYLNWGEKQTPEIKGLINF